MSCRSSSTHLARLDSSIPGKISARCLLPPRNGARRKRPTIRWMSRVSGDPAVGPLRKPHGWHHQPLKG
jgi:hypothetical protein